jgi:hypothetical protein
MSRACNGPFKEISSWTLRWNKVPAVLANMTKPLFAERRRIRERGMGGRHCCCVSRQERRGSPVPTTEKRRCLLYYPCSLDIKNSNVVFFSGKGKSGKMICRLIEPWYQGRQSFKSQMEAAGVHRILDLQNFLP